MNDKTDTPKKSPKMPPKLATNWVKVNSGVRFRNEKSSCLKIIETSASEPVALLYEFICYWIGKSLWDQAHLKLSE